MNIFYQLGEESRYVKYQNDKLQFRKKIDQSIFNCSKLDIKQTNYLLIDESYFNFFTQDYFLEDRKSKVSIDDLQELINSERKKIKAEYDQVGDFLTANINQVLVDGEKHDYLLGQKGDIYTKLSFFYLQNHISNKFKRGYGNSFFQKQSINIYPKSFFLVNILKKQLQRKRINVLYILEDKAKLVKIEQGAYKHINSIDLGSHALKKIFKENNALELYYDCFKNDNMSCMQQKVIEKSLSFYNNTLVEWIKDKLGDNSKDLILVSDLIENKSFLKLFGNKYSEKISGYLIPFHFSKKFDNFGQKWKNNEFDILALLNYEC